ncbi:Sec-independent protein translocase subunit TatA/TatB [Deinococcus arcticus]|uniref:Sec-independent protein translocase protein TatA n=1 Tax=Deinococcus arcticus TaxID=2136176 RepID=A0A2T3WCM0_9DEIO|nr:twin-arginine translocase TatA/TatE family subunit [Deinococcus arcticus]PTA69554.1 twin-arginine translocase TatA/TatE family subunit [Deinococcus arcticus]
MPNIGPAELIMILLVALVVFGPRKLPELGKSLGHGLREFRRTTQGLKDELSLSAAPAAVAPVPVATATPEAVVPAAPAPAPVAAHTLIATEAKPD